MLRARTIDHAAALRARRRLAAWISEHGQQDAATCDLLAVVADLDKALDIAEREPTSDELAHRVVKVRAYDGLVVSNYGEGLSREWADKIARYAHATLDDDPDPMVIVEIQARPWPAPTPPWVPVVTLTREEADGAS